LSTGLVVSQGKEKELRQKLCDKHKVSGLLLLLKKGWPFFEGGVFVGRKTTKPLTFDTAFKGRLAFDFWTGLSKPHVSPK
jgi:hypothetical protein